MGIVLSAVYLAGMMASAPSARGQELADSQVDSKPLAGTIRIHGSETMRPLLEAWSVDFMRLHPGVQFELRSEGSLLAVASFAEKIPAIGALSSKLSDRDATELSAVGVDKVIHIPVARDQIAVIVNPNNPITSLTLPQLKQIFQESTAGATRWKQLNSNSSSKDEPIVLVGPHELSGTRAAFANQVVGSDGSLSERLLSCDNHAAIMERVLADANAIGFLSTTWLDDSASILAIAESDSSPALLPSMEAGPSADPKAKYALERELYLLIRGSGEMKPSLTERKFIEFVLSKQGSTATKRVRFLPLSDDRLQEARGQLKALSSE
jgi:phosphate transport system substrate-binding protein